MYQQTQLNILCTYRSYLYVYVHEVHQVHHLRWTKLEVNHHKEQIPYMLKTWWMGRLADSTPPRSIFLLFSQKIHNNFLLFSINLRFCLKFETPICTSSFKSRGYTPAPTRTTTVPFFGGLFHGYDRRKYQEHPHAAVA